MLVSRCLLMGGRLPLALFSLGLFSLGLAPVQSLAQTEPSVQLSLTSREVPAGCAAQVPVVMTFDPQQCSCDVIAWSYSVCHDTVLLELEELLMGADTAALNFGVGPAFHSPVIQGDGFSVVTVVSFDDPFAALPQGVYELDVPSYQTVGAVGSSADVSFCGLMVCDPTPPNDCVLVEAEVGTTEFATHSPETFSATVDVVPSLSRMSLTCSEVSLGAMAQLPILLTFTPGNCSCDVIAWSYSVCHDSTLLEFDEVLMGVDTLALNGGAGPAFYSPVIQGDGFSVVTVVSFDDVSAAIPQGVYELDVPSYQTLGAVGTSAEVSFCSLLVCDSTPPDCVQVDAEVGTTEFATRPSGKLSATVDVVASFSPMFLRGDVDTLGGLNVLPDTLTLLGWLFLGEAEPPCLDGADFNDDGSIGITDALGILNYGFASGLPPAQPGLACGIDCTEDTLTCLSPSCP